MITLIFAGRNRRDMIRRELPRTERAGRVRKPFRIEHRRVLLFMGPRLSSALRSRKISRVKLAGKLHLFFGVHGDGPQEAK